MSGETLREAPGRPQPGHIYQQSLGSPSGGVMGMEYGAPARGSARRRGERERGEEEWDGVGVWWW